MLNAKSPDLIPIGQAAEITGMTVAAIRQRVLRNAIPFIRSKDGHTWFNPEKLLEWKAIVASKISQRQQVFNAISRKPQTCAEITAKLSIDPKLANICLFKLTKLGRIQRKGSWGMFTYQRKQYF
jgi:hypothetical protein